MNAKQREKTLSIARKLMPPDEFDRILSVGVNDMGFGYDQFGMEKESVILAYALFRYFHKYWFRVKSEGHANIPQTGPALLVGNHSGTLPIDAAMIGIDVAAKMEKPRAMRAIVDNFAGFLPFLNVFFYRAGQVIGHRRNFQDLLAAGELVCVLPEGTRGLGKPFAQRYNLEKFAVGFIELSLTHRAPIIPVAVIGAEEQMPMIANLKSFARLLGFPYFPITPLFPFLGPLGLVPLPTQYHIYYGTPLRYFEDYGPETVDDPEIVRMLADKVRLVVQDLINHGLEKRTSVFGFGEE